MITDLENERKKTSFDPVKLSHFLYSQEVYERIMTIFPQLNSVPHDLNLYGRGRVEMIKQSIRALPINGHTLEFGNDVTYLPNILYEQTQLPGSLHIGMFITCIKILGTDGQQQKMLPKCANHEMFGCYAQTEIGHGSDVQGLETTAEFDKTTDEFVLNTPTISATKFWPGDLGLYANYALVFAKMIVNGQSFGVHSFIVQIRDENGQLLPGVEAGDIGPKFGFITKDNGFLILKNIRIPRKNMLRRFVSVSREGELKIKGNPKISYATMMMVRKMLSFIHTKQLGCGLTIAGKYSIMRRQFRNDQGQEIPVIDYQLQQNKLLTCMADYYAMAVGAQKITKLVEINFKMVSQNDDDSLMAETHACLCLSKAYWTDLVMRDLEICRLACGGHGFSHYSGLPTLIQQFSPNVTLEGENSVLLLQLARYLMKSYKYTLTKKKALAPSVKYLESFEYLKEKKCQVAEDAANDWNLQNIRVLIAQSVCHLISKVSEKMMANEGGSQKETWGKFAALRLNQAAIMHAAYYTYTSFEEAAIKFSDEVAKPIVFDLCLLFGVNVILTRPYPIIESELVEPHHLKSLQVCRDNLLRRLRPSFMGLIDGIGIPDYVLKSALVSGTNVYDNLLDWARKNEVNKQINPGVWELKKNLKNMRPKF